MDRNSRAYKLRRKMQIMANAIMPEEMMVKLYGRIVLGRWMNLDKPKTFNEKISWLKIHHFPFNNLVVQCADKFAVREYICKKGFGELLVPMLGSWDSVEEIDWDSLPSQFVLKCNHGCAYNLICHDKSKFDIFTAKKQLDQWIKEDFGAFNIEPHYSKIKKKKIICEKFLGDKITDYKFFCFHGNPKYLYVSNDLIHDREAQIGFFYLDGTKMDMKRDDYADIPAVSFGEGYKDMIAISSKLAEAFIFVRVDYFVLKDRYYFAELTFTPSAGMMPFNPEKFDVKWGEMIDLRYCTQEGN